MSWITDTIEAHIQNATSVEQPPTSATELDEQTLGDLVPILVNNELLLGADPNYPDIVEIHFKGNSPGSGVVKGFMTYFKKTINDNPALLEKYLVGIMVGFTQETANGMAQALQSVAEREGIDTCVHLFSITADDNYRLHQTPCASHVPVPIDNGQLDLAIGDKLIKGMLAEDKLRRELARRGFHGADISTNMTIYIAVVEVLSEVGES